MRRTTIMEAYRLGRDPGAIYTVREARASTPTNDTRRMMKQPSQTIGGEGPAAEIVGHDDHIAPAPRVSVQAFCETVETAAAIQAAGEDRRMAKAHLRIQMGGLTAAVEAYQKLSDPNVIILESEHPTRISSEASISLPIIATPAPGSRSSAA